MLLLYLVIDFLAHSADAQVSIDGCYSSMCNLQNDSYSLYNALATNCSSTNRSASYWWYNKRNSGIQLNNNPKWIPYMNSTKDLVVLLPGLGEDIVYASTGQIKDAYFDSSDSVPEIIEVDYNVGLLSASLYSPPNGVCNYFDVSEKLAKFISNLNTSVGFQIENMHLIGVSFGAHLAGVTGYLLQTKYGYTLKRITGLDPLGAGYNCVTCPSLRLNKGDARFVDGIHTNPGRLGVLKPLGDIDFYVNWPYYLSYYINFNYSPNHGPLVTDAKSGAGFYFRIPSWIQPGCGNATDADRCSALRSAALFAESILINDLRGSSCPIPSSFPVCILTDYAYMGLHAPNSSIYQVYYVKTNASPPYGRYPPGSRNNSKYPDGIKLPGFDPIALPPIRWSLPVFANFSESLNQVSLPGFRGSTLPSSGKRTRGLGRRGPTTTASTQSTAGRGGRRLFF